MPNQFCTHCGAALVRSARFCVECGAALSGAAPRAGGIAWQRFAPLLIVGSVLLVGAGAVLIGAQNAKEPPRIPPRNLPPAQQVPEDAKLPEGHPAVPLPETAREILRKKAEEV